MLGAVYVPHVDRGLGVIAEGLTHRELRVLAGGDSQPSHSAGIALSPREPPSLLAQRQPTSNDRLVGVGPPAPWGQRSFQSSLKDQLRPRL